MTRKITFLVAAFYAVFFSASVSAEQEICDQDLKDRFEELSDSTLVGGAGWEAYEKILHPAYSRWAMGEIYEGREKFIRSLEDWWNYGMRVAARDVEIVGVDMSDDLAIIRFTTTESFVGPEGPVDGFSGYVSNIWVKHDNDWMLLAAEISSTAQ